MPVTDADLVERMAKKHRCRPRRSKSSSRLSGAEAAEWPSSATPISAGCRNGPGHVHGGRHVQYTAEAKLDALCMTSRRIWTRPRLPAARDLSRTTSATVQMSGSADWWPAGLGGLARGCSERPPVRVFRRRVGW